MQRMFLVCDDVARFCTELKKGALEGLCISVSEGLFPVVEDKIEVCFRPTPLPPDWYWSMPESTIKSW